MPAISGRPAWRIYQLAWGILDWLYPPRCGGCNRLYSRWCSHCREQVRLVQPPLCERCGKMIQAGRICAECHSSSPAFAALRSWAVYEGGLRHAILRLKYEGDLALGEILARPMLELLQTLGWDFELVIPVPISLARKKERGYNQASLLALPIALGWGAAYRPEALKKVRDTPSQVGLTVAQRRQNVLDAFEAQEKFVSGRSVLVVDDVTTSGATMEASSRALKNAGTRQVFGITLARAAVDTR